MGFVAQSIAGLRFLQLRNSSEVSGVKFRNGYLSLPLQENDGAETLGHASVGIEWLQFRRQRPGIYTEKRDAAGNGIRKCFENESRERLGSRHLSLDVFALRILSRNSSARSGIRQEIHYRVQQRLNTDIARRRREKNRINFPVAYLFPEPRDQVFVRQRTVIENFFHQFLIALLHSFTELFMVLIGPCSRVCRVVRFAGLSGALRLFL